MDTLDYAKTPGDTSWFVRDRFGLFIHFGLYSLPARKEWVMRLENIHPDEYEKYFKHFNPDLYDPNLWADLAYIAGMKYYVITTRHHEGFSLWDTKYSEYKSTNTPYGKDLLHPMVDAFRSRGLKTGFYYSLLDWYHPDYIIDYFHPLCDLPKEEVLAMNAKRCQANYNKFMRDQLTELCTEFGKIDVFWFDFEYGISYEDHNSIVEPYVKNCPYLTGKWAKDFECKELIDLVRKYQPDTVIDKRFNIYDDTGKVIDYSDFIAMEQTILEEAPRNENGERIPWEICMTFSGYYGYDRDEIKWKTTKQVLNSLIKIVAKGGNFLLNVGPTGRGEFDERAVRILKEIGEWMKYNNQSIYGCGEPPKGIEACEGTALTYNPEKNRLYVHLLDYPELGCAFVKGITGKVEYAQFLHDKSETRINYMPGQVGEVPPSNKELVFFNVPIQKPNVEIPVIEVFLKS